MVARNPGVTNVYATLNGTKSAPLAFVTCPPSSIVLTILRGHGYRVAAGFSTTPYPYTTGDLTLNKGDQEYLNATMLDTNGNPLITSPLSYITSNPLTGSFTTTLAADLDADGEHRGTLHRHGLLRTDQLQQFGGRFRLPGGSEYGKGCLALVIRSTAM